MATKSATFSEAFLGGPEGPSKASWRHSLRFGGALNRCWNGLAAPFGRFKPDVAARLDTLCRPALFFLNLSKFPSACLHGIRELPQAGQIARVQLPLAPHFQAEIVDKCK